MISAVVLIGVTAVAAVVFGRRILFLTRLVRVGAATNRRPTTTEGMHNEAVIVLGQRKLLYRLVPGLMHAFIFWGFLVLAPTIVTALIAIVDRDQTIPWLGHQGWFAFLVDLFSLLVAVGVVAALVIRKVQRPRRFEGSHRGEADLILALIGLIIVSLVAWHATRIALGLNEYGASSAPLSDAVSNLFGRGATTRAAERIFVWTHVLVILSFLAYLPHSKHLHIVTAAINVYFARSRLRGRLEPLRFDDAASDEDLRFGAGTAADLTWKQMLDTVTCTECGRCQDVCPAFATGKKLSPKLLIMDLRDQLLKDGPGLVAAARGSDTYTPAPLVPGAVTDEVIWDCVTCGACVRECPVSIDHVDHIIDLRRHLVMVESRFPTEAASMLRDVERSANPWGKPQTDRAAWAAGLGVRVLEPGDTPPEYLYWVGCAAAFDERARRSAESVVKLLHAAGVDVAILGPRESCTGDPARRMGDEYTFQSYAQRNISTLNDSGITRVIASCPHCYNTLANEYPDFGGSYRVSHHTEVLNELVSAGRLRPQRSDTTITYHDSCYLARHNDVLDAPRDLVGSVGEAVEMPRHGRRTFCCGAGGAHMWMEERAAPINEARVREASATGASTLAVACPFCMIMLDDGVRSTGAELRVADVATLLAETIPDPPAAPASPDAGSADH